MSVRCPSGRRTRHIPGHDPAHGWEHASDAAVGAVPHQFCVRGSSLLGGARNGRRRPLMRFLRVERRQSRRLIVLFGTSAYRGATGWSRSHLVPVFFFTRSAICMSPSRTCAYVHTGTCGTTGTILRYQWVVGPSHRPRSHSRLGPHGDSATRAMAADRDSAPSREPSDSAPRGSDRLASSARARSAGSKELHRC